MAFRVRSPYLIHQGGQHLHELVRLGLGLLRENSVAREQGMVPRLIRGEVVRSLDGLHQRTKHLSDNGASLLGARGRGGQRLHGRIHSSKVQACHGVLPGNCLV